ncbi:Pimeloyl-ACP methyl ester carboxylesterase [Raineyella antarctica]|uniref:Pimeloyl-ACP methyl ester carboxylesterase n=1 Tax=Raineyella antarctica TaxID=1577474 RepID=A0A1G6GI91_9ACTN|nr:alpha/beta hydrolase [Raineyella antarctica]SDB80886.1 Pimeloyl-ACP methyl ester carboxylesterase [Raineyella antarctica]
MSTTTHQSPLLSHDDAGSGTPVVLIHGLTFDRRSWRPITDCLGGQVRTIAVDLPGHGDSSGPPTTLEEAATRIHSVVESLGLAHPVVVGHSFAAGIAALYAAHYPTQGLVMIDSGPEVQPFAEFVRQLAPLLRGPGFAKAWPAFEDSLGLDLIPEPVQSLVRSGHRVEEAVVLGYWEQMMSSQPADFQAWIDSVLPLIRVPVLAVWGHPVSEGDKLRFSRFHDVEFDVHPIDGHFVHLVDPVRFAQNLRRFVDRCVLTA